MSSLITHFPVVVHFEHPLQGAMRFLPSEIFDTMAPLFFASFSATSSSVSVFPPFLELPMIPRIFIFHLHEPETCSFDQGLSNRQEADRGLENGAPGGAMPPQRGTTGTTELGTEAGRNPTVMAMLPPADYNNPLEREMLP
jgi:hypothetical protein